MQAWNQVKAVAGDFEGRAGVVQGVTEEGVTVLFDGDDAPVMVQADELELLG